MCKSSRITLCVNKGTPARSTTRHLLKNKRFEPQRLSHSSLCKDARMAAEIIVFYPKRLSTIEFKANQISIYHRFTTRSGTLECIGKTVPNGRGPEHRSTSTQPTLFLSLVFKPHLP